MSTKQFRVNSESQSRRSDLIDPDDIPGVIVLLRHENERLRQIPERLSAEAECIRRSLLPGLASRRSLEKRSLRHLVRGPVVAATLRISGDHARSSSEKKNSLVYRI